MKKSKHLTIGSLMLIGQIMAQDIHFSQFIMTPLLINPSEAGKFGGNYRGILNYRQQWRSISPKPYVTYGGTFDMSFNQSGLKRNFFGGGIIAYGDKAGFGSLSTNMISLTIAYHLNIAKNQYLSGGMQGTLLQRAINTNNLRFDNQFDVNIGAHNPALNHMENFNQLNVVKGSISGGVSYNYSDNTGNNVISNNGYQGKIINIGAAVFYVNSPDYSFNNIVQDKLALRYVFHTFTSFGIPNYNIAIQPSGLLYYQNKATDILVGGMIRYTLKEQSKYTQIVKGAALSIGLHHRLQDALIPSILLEMGSLAFGVSYDINSSSLKTASAGRGGLEVSIRYVSPNPFRSKSKARFN